MQRNSKAKFSLGVIIVLVCLNVVSVTLVWFQHFDRPSMPGAHGIDPQGFFVRELNLDQEQADSMMQIRHEYFHLTDSIRYEIAMLSERLVNEVFADTADTALVGRLSDQIGEEQAVLERMLFSHFERVKRLCTPEQQVRLRSLILDIFRAKQLPPPDRMDGGPFPRPGQPMDGGGGRIPPPPGNQMPPPDDRRPPGR